MKNFLPSLSVFFKKHWLAVGMACVVGAVMLAPQIIFMLREGSQYQGLYMMMRTNDELHYLASMHEFYDEGRIGNPYLFEHKYYGPQFWSSGSETILAAPGVLFHIPVPTLNLIYKFLLPTIGFLLTYGLLFRLTRSISWSIAGGLMVIMGLTWLDWDHLSNFFAGDRRDFLLSSRPVNPGFSGVLFFLYLHALLSIQEGKRQGRWFLCLGALLALSFYTYFFSFTFFLTLNAVFFAIWFFQKRFALLRHISLATVGATLLGLPVLSMMYATLHHPDFGALNEGLKVASRHRPILNRPGFFTTALFSMHVFFTKLYKKPGAPQERAFFLLGLLAAAFLVLNQQVITGVTLAYAHYIRFFDLPIFAIVLTYLLSLWLTLPAFNTRAWGRTAMLLPWGLSLIFIVTGIAIQYGGYERFAPQTAADQRYMPALKWLKDNTSKESVVMADEPLSELIPVYTSDNVMWDSEHILCCYLLPPGRAAFTPDAVLAAPDFFRAIKAYRVDYILWDSKNEPNWNIPRLHLTPLFSYDGLFLYQVPK